MNMYPYTIIARNHRSKEYEFSLNCKGRKRKRKKKQGFSKWYPRLTMSTGNLSVP